MTKAECEQAVSEGTLGITACNYDSDYWAGAVRACGGVQNMPTQAQLIALAEYIYPDADSIYGGDADSIFGGSSTTYANWDADRASIFMAQTPSGYSEFHVWSGQESSQYNAYYRTFNPAGTYWDDIYRRNLSNKLAVCLDQ